MTAKRKASVISTTATPRQDLAQAILRAIPEAGLSWKFGNASLDVDGRVFAFTRSNAGAAMKLPQARVAALLAAGEAELLTMGKRTMREWVVVPEATSPVALELLREARVYVASLPASRNRKKVSGKRESDTCL